VNSVDYSMCGLLQEKVCKTRTTERTSINDVTQFEGKIDPTCPSVTLGHKSQTPLPKLRHKLTTPSL